MATSVCRSQKHTEHRNKILTLLRVRCRLNSLNPLKIIKKAGKEGASNESAAARMDRGKKRGRDNEEEKLHRLGRANERESEREGEIKGER